MFGSCTWKRDRLKESSSVTLWANSRDHHHPAQTQVSPRLLLSTCIGLGVYVHLCNVLVWWLCLLDFVCVCVVSVGWLVCCFVCVFVDGESWHNMTRARARSRCPLTRHLSEGKLVFTSQRKPLNTEVNCCFIISLHIHSLNVMTMSERHGVARHGLRLYCCPLFGGGEE